MSPTAPDAAGLTSTTDSRGSGEPRGFQTGIERGAGNRATARLLQRQSSPPTPPEQRGSSPRQGAAIPAPGAPSSGDRELFEHGVSANGDTDSLQRVNGWWNFSEADRMVAIDALVQGAHLWTGPLDEAAAERIWDSFGKDVPEVANRHISLWNRSLERGVEVADIPAMREFRRTFESDVRAVAAGFMEANVTSVHKEIDQLGAESSAASPDVQKERDDRLRFTQDLMVEVEKASEAAAALRRIPVGYDIVKTHQFDEPVERRSKVFFNPDHQPDEAGGGEAGFAAWSAVSEQWERIQAVLKNYARLSPTVHIALRDGKVSELAHASPLDARRTISEQLRTTETKIKETQPKLASDDLDWRDLRPIHQQLYSGYSAPSGTKWNNPILKTIGEDIVADHESMETLLAIGGGILAAALFVVAEIATGGLATFCLVGGIGIGVGQAARSWEQWEDLNTASKASTSPDTELVSSGQADAALLTAMLDTVFAFIDIFPFAKVGRYFGVGAGGLNAAAKAGRDASVRHALSDLAKGAIKAGSEAEKAVIVRGISELGVHETMRRTEKSVEQLLATVGEKSAEAEYLRAYKAALEAAGKGGANAAQKQVAEALTKLAKGGLTGQAAEKAVRDSLAVLGPAETIKHCDGWSKLASVLGNESATGKQLVAWRDAAFKDLTVWAEKNLDRTGLAEGQKVIEATGSFGAFKNDLDISLHGTNAADNRRLARAYLADRVGCSTSELSKLLKNDFFTSAARMHAYDSVSEVIRDGIRNRQAVVQQQLLMNAELQTAKQEGKEGVVAELRSQMAAAGIPEKPVSIASKAEAEALSLEVDKLQQELIDAATSGDLKAQERLANAIGDRQAMINVAEEGGYFTSGGTRRFVTERAARDAKDFAGEAMHVSERLSAMVDQIPKLEHAAKELHTALGKGSLAEITDAVRSIGKYGERLSKAGFKGAPEGKLKELQEFLEALKSSADDGFVREELPTILSQTEHLLSSVTAESSAMLRALRDEAKLAHDIVSIEAMSQAMTAHARWLDFSAKLPKAMARTIPSAGRALNQLDDPPKTSPGRSVDRIVELHLAATPQF